MKRVPRKEPQKPALNASMDAWLDWRDAAKMYGYNVTLQTIVDQGGFSINTLKKKSAERRRPSRNDG